MTVLFPEFLDTDVKGSNSHNACLRSRRCPRRAFGVSKVTISNVGVHEYVDPKKRGISICASNTQLNKRIGKKTFMLYI